MAEISLLKSPKSPIINFVLEKSFRDVFLEKWSVRDERWILYTVIFSVKEIILDRNEGEKEKVNTTLTNKQTNKQLCGHIEIHLSRPTQIQNATCRTFWEAKAS